MPRRKFRVVLVSAPRGRRAEALARGLVEARLAACVNVIPGVVSHYRWEGKLRRGAECLLVIKTTSSLLKALERWVKAHHPNSVPEVIALGIAAGSRDYLRWLAAQVS